MSALRRTVALAGVLAAATTIMLGAGVALAAETGPAPDYRARIIGTEEEASLADLRGQVVLLNTWATWCEPCKEEMPDFEAFYQRHRSDGLVVVGVSIDEGRADGRVGRFAEGLGVTFPIWRDPANHFAKTFRVLGVPETLLIDRDGEIRYHWRGQLDPDAPENRERILAALEGDAAAASAGPAVASAGLLVAFGAGLLSVLSPCVLPLIPSYASVIGGVSANRRRQPAGVAPAAVAPVPARSGGGLPAADPGAAPADVEPADAGPAGRRDRRPALWAGVSFVAGFSAVFMALGVLVNRAGAALADNRIWLSRLGGVVLVVLGLHLLGVLRVRAAEREVRFLNLKASQRAGYAGVFLVGVAFAAGWSPCIGPVLAGILTMAASGGSTAQAAVLLGAYCAGLAIPFLVAAFALDRFLGWSAGLRRSWLPVAERVSGALVVAVGLLMVSGVFSRMAAWLAA